MKTIADELRDALALTERALAAQTMHDAEIAVALRAPILERASEAKEAGKPWGETEAQLAQDLMTADVQLIQMLWAPHVEVFAWLKGRDPDKVADMPHLRQLCGD